MARYIVQHRRGSALQWADNNTIIPMEGEIVIEIDEENSLHKLKIGDGIHTYAELAYLMAGDEVVTQVLSKALPRVVTVSLDIDKWTEVTCETDPNLGYYGQQVSIDNITEYSRLDLQPDADMLAEFQKLNLVFTTENKNGVITVYSIGDVPLKSYTMQATIVETEFDVVGDKIVGAPVGTPTTQPDWAQTNDTKADYIKNKPTIPAIDGLATETFVNDQLLAKQDKFADINTFNDEPYLVMEAKTHLSGSGESGLLIHNLADPQNQQDATNKQYVDGQVKTINDKLNTLSSGGLTRAIVAELPSAASASETTIYMVGPQTDTSGNNIYEEYMFINGQPELIGSTAVDLSGKQDKFADITFDDMGTTVTIAEGMFNIIAEDSINIETPEEINLQSSTGMTLSADSDLYISGATTIITNVTNPTNATDATNKKYVDDLVGQKQDKFAEVDTSNGYPILNSTGILEINSNEAINLFGSGQFTLYAGENDDTYIEGYTDSLDIKSRDAIHIQQNNADTTSDFYLLNGNVNLEGDRIDVISTGDIGLVAETSIAIDSPEVNIHGVSDPTEDTDAANKKYVDSQVFASNVGKRTEDGGEIFNAYGEVAEDGQQYENTALTQFASAFNENTQAGAKAFKILGYVNHSFDDVSYAGFRFKNSNDGWIFRNGENISEVTALDTTALSNKDLSVEIQFVPEAGFAGYVNMTMNQVADDGSVTPIFSADDCYIGSFTNPSFIVMTSSANSSWLTIKNVRITQGEQHIEFDYNNYTRLREDTYSGFELITDDATGNIIGFTQNKDSRIQFNIDDMGVTCHEPFTITFDIHTINSNYGTSNYYSFYLTKYEPSTQGAYIVENDGTVYDDILETVSIHSTQQNRYSLYFSNNYECRGNILDVSYADDGNIMSFLVDNFFEPTVAADQEIFNNEEGLIRAVEHPLCGVETIGRGAFSKGLNTRADHDYSSAEGRDTVAIGKYSHVEGRGTQAGWCAHAQGREALALGLVAHAQGYRTTATGYASSATGCTTTASGRYSYTMGESSHAAGLRSFAGGKWTTAAGENSLSFGDHAYAKGTNQVVFGTHNIQNADPIFIIGNGASETARSNAFAVNADGTATLGANPVNDMDVATKQYVEDYVATYISEALGGEY